MCCAGATLAPAMMRIKEGSVRVEKRHEVSAILPRLRFAHQVDHLPPDLHTKHGKQEQHSIYIELLPEYALVLRLVKE